MNDYEKVQSCVVQVTQQEPYLTGENVMIAVLDSGDRVIIMSSW